jgi:DNA replication initiation complex subunit (GINS family)
MNSFFLLATLVVLSLSSVHSRSVSFDQQFQRRAEKPPSSRLCKIIVGAVVKLLDDPSLNLTPEQKKLIPDVSQRKRAAGGAVCQEELDQLVNSLTPFFQSLSPEQLQALKELFPSPTTDSGKDVKKTRAFFKRRLLELLMDNEEEDE